ncbi:MAG: GxxExxY protein [Spirochaetales bacterium]|nr:GxxExxY protein [Spirochaetales bacterium]
MFIHKELSYNIVGAMMEVHTILGPGLAESLYEGALEIEFRNRGLEFQRQKPFKYYYKGELAGYYIADMVVEEKVIIELKAVTQLHECMEAQLLNYMNIAKIKLGYLANFRNKRLEYQRFIK